MGAAKRVVITGANSGVGFEASRILAGDGWDVVMVSRSPDRGQAALEKVRAEHPGASLSVEQCDLASFAQVRDLASRLGAAEEDGDGPVHALVNNAGLYRANREITEDGFERTMAVNHLGHFLLTSLLKSNLRASGARIVNVSSGGHSMGRLSAGSIDSVFRGEERYDGWRYYGHSKLANVLFSAELHRRWNGDGVEAFAVHPGVLSTAIWDRNRTFGMFIAKLAKPFMDSPEVGGRAVSRLVSDPEVSSKSGGYFRKQDHAAPSALAQDEALARALWDASEAAVGLEPS